MFAASCFSTANPIFSVRKQGAVFLLVPTVGNLVAAKPQADTAVDLDRLPSTGRVRLVLRGEPSFELAAARFDKLHRELPWDDAGLRMRLRPSATDPTHAEVLRR